MVKGVAEDWGFVKIDFLPIWGMRWGATLLLLHAILQSSFVVIGRKVHSGMGH